MEEKHIRFISQNTGLLIHIIYVLDLGLRMVGDHGHCDCNSTETRDTISVPCGEVFSPSY